METSLIERIRDLLDECYGRKEWEQGRPILDELIYTILSQNTSAANCDQAFRELTNRFGTWEAVMGARIEDIADAIRGGGLANRKAPRIRRILQEVFERQGNLDLDWIATAPDSEAIDYLLAFDGVGRKTAACVLMFSLGRPVLPVDTHVHRVAMRLGLIGKCSADDAHDLLRAMITTEHPEPVEGRIYSFHMNMVAHGRQVCHARGPECPKCVLKRECNDMTDEIHGQGEDLVVVFRAPDEFTANIVRGLLVGEDIPVVLESRQVAMYDGALTMGEGYWGDVVVPEQYAARSRELIDAYRDSAELES